MDGSGSGIPDGTTGTFRRAAFAAWLDAHAASPLRLVVAPCGAGKTTATAAWARERAAQVAWLTVPPHCTARTLRAELDALLAARGGAALTVVIDDVERADPGARELLGRLYATAPETVGFVYLARSFAALDLRAGESRGVVAVADGDLLRFGSAEIGLLCDALGVASTPHDRVRTWRATGGWAAAVTACVGWAAAAGLPLTGAFARWVREHKSVVAALVARALRGAAEADAALLRAVLAADAAPSAGELRRLAHAGLFVDDLGDGQALNPVIAQAFGRPALAPPAPEETEPGVLEMFGRFRLRCGGREVAFARRRDAQIVQFLALRPDGRATRAELLAAFWPEGDRQLAAQGLRTAVSAIRRALAACVGREQVDRYLTSDGPAVALRFEAVVSTAHRFQAHAQLAAAADARGDGAAADAHWSAARRLYVAPLLAGEAGAPWIEPFARACAELAAAAWDRTGGELAADAIA